MNKTTSRLAVLGFAALSWLAMSGAPALACSGCKARLAPSAEQGWVAYIFSKTLGVATSAVSDMNMGSASFSLACACLTVVYLRYLWRVCGR
jgi:hypothetical protein